MASFLTHRRLVLDRTLPARRRHAALRTCLTLYAPYGFRSTYHHLTVNAAIPRDLDADPESLESAVNELHEARAPDGRGRQVRAAATHPQSGKSFTQRA